MKKLLTWCLSLLLVFPALVSAQGVPDADAYVFARHDCSHCQSLKEFVAEHNLKEYDYNIQYIDVYSQQGKALFDQATDLLGTGKVTPITFVNGQVYIGFSEDVLGNVLTAHSQEKNRAVISFDSYFDQEKIVEESGSGCRENSLEPCLGEEKTMNIPVVGQIDPQATSLSFLAIVLGFVDGFNPCAMWVLLTFLLILSQVGDRKKMIQVAGLFIVAEAFMYYLILNIWYQTWDFIALDGVVTPLVGLLALGSGLFFLYKYWSSRNKPLTCEVTSIEHQQKTENKIKEMVSKPMTIVLAVSIIGLALSVNIIEFACSVGIPQAFTKILELNNLSFAQYQGYTLLYTLFYMADDFIVFGLAIWGYQKFYAVGQKYSRYSTGIAGVLMLILGIILITNPDLLSY